MAGVCALNHFIIEDELLLYAMMFLTFVLILILKMKARTRIWNFVVYAGYNIPLLYCLYRKGDYGTSLYWWTFSLLSNIAHLLALILFSAINQLKKR